MWSPWRVEPLACSRALLCSPLPLPCTHLPFRQLQDTARGQLGGSQEFGLQCLGAYQWVVVQLGIPELLSHISAGNYKSPSAEPEVLQYLALCNFASSANNRSGHFCSASDRPSSYMLWIHKELVGLILPPCQSY